MMIPRRLSLLMIRLLDLGITSQTKQWGHYQLLQDLSSLGISRISALHLVVSSRGSWNPLNQTMWVLGIMMYHIGYPNHLL